VIFGTGQRRQEEKLDQVQWQFVLDNFDIAVDLFRRIVRKSEDVSRIGDDADILPGLQHLAVFPDLVLAFLGCHQRIWIDVFKPDENPIAASSRGKFYEPFQPVAQCVDLDDEFEAQLFLFPQIGQPLQNRLPVLVACEIVVGDEEALDALRMVLANDRLNVVG